MINLGRGARIPPKTAKAEWIELHASYWRTQRRQQLDERERRVRRIHEIERRIARLRTRPENSERGALLRSLEAELEMLKRH